MNPGLYIHIPFCRSKCPYCGFYSIASTSAIPEWADALNRETSLYKGSFKESFDSLYLGGGTPTVLDTEQLKRIMDCVFDCLQFKDNTEITIETNPGDIDGKRSATLKAAGLNRINLGVQSFNDDELLFLGRRHDSAKARESISCLRESGFDNIGIDLIYGLPGQSVETWKNDLETAVSFQPEHISCYQLSIEEETPFAKMKEKGLIEPIEERMEELFFLLTSKFLEDNGYIHYEISNFAKGEDYYSRHNRKYWDHTPYLGLGPSAHSFNGGARWWNLRSVRRYCETLERSKSPVEGHEDLTDEQIMMEKISLGLRTMWGLDMNVLNPDKEQDKIIAMLEESGHIRVRGGRIIPTKRGFLIADRLPLYLLPA